MEHRSDGIAKAITRAIVNKRLAPGCKLSEQTLADVFKVSRTVVRQAIIKLTEDGLVTIERNRGAYVSTPSYRDAVEIYDALTILEQGVAAQLAGRLDARSWSELRRHVELQHKAVEEHQDGLADQLGSGFHELLIKFSNNSVVQAMHSQLIRRTSLLRFLVDSRFDYCGLLHDHAVLVDLLEEGQVAEAQKLIDEHHRTVVRGYLLDMERIPKMSAREALAPFVEAATEGGPPG
ncbi:GntR family transcriptional regulator [Oceanibium sediminis]|uniref:GntR family transcriptional regulator n=1 Tax=Oceanibium sediminis TaxID=2026339 RepID=UPI000DD3EB95|nr:GntR family transcriptional regulator [Oceanibium sediminis]